MHEFGDQSAPLAFIAPTKIELNWTVIFLTCGLRYVVFCSAAKIILCYRFPVRMEVLSMSPQFTAGADPGIPMWVGGGGVSTPFGEYQHPMRVIFNKNVCENDRIGPIGGHPWICQCQWLTRAAHSIWSPQGDGSHQGWVSSLLELRLESSIETIIDGEEFFICRSHVYMCPCHM